MKKIVALSLFFVLFSGCAFGHTVHYPYYEYEEYYVVVPPPYKVVYKTYYHKHYHKHKIYKKKYYKKRYKKRYRKRFNHHH